MKIKFLVDEDFSNYKEPSMFIGFPNCTFKCGRDVCQNVALAQESNIEINCDKLITRFMDNPITKAIVCGGLEPFDSWEDLRCLIMNLRLHSNCPIVIYSGYEEREISEDWINWLRIYAGDGPIIVKWGRFIPNDKKYFNDELGVNLASKNQYTVRYT